MSLIALIVLEVRAKSRHSFGAILVLVWCDFLSKRKEVGVKPVANGQAVYEAVAAIPQGGGIDAIGAALPHIPRRMAYAQAIAENDRANFIAMVLDDIRRLHEGVLVRYGLTLAELYAWKDKLNV